MKTSEVLNRAADLIEERGWTQGEGWPDAEDDVTGLCLEGGIMAAAGFGFNDYTKFVRCPAYLAVENYLAHETRFPFTWNDRDGRTAAEVIEVLRACAVIEQAREEQDAAWATYAEVVTA